MAGAEVVKRREEEAKEEEVEQEGAVRQAAAVTAADLVAGDCASVSLAILASSSAVLLLAGVMADCMRVNGEKQPRLRLCPPRPFSSLRAARLPSRPLARLAFDFGPVAAAPRDAPSDLTSQLRPALRSHHRPRARVTSHHFLLDDDDDADDAA